MSEAQMNGAVQSPAAQTIFTNDSRVVCNGGGGPLGHPQVWLTLGSDGQVMCPYCSRHFAAAGPQADDSYAHRDTENSRHRGPDDAGEATTFIG